MFLVFLLLFTVLPALELYLLIKIGGAIGGLNTIAIIIFTGIVGAYYARSQGFGIFSELQNKLQKGELPTSTLGEGVLVLAGGLLLMTPGFLTDALGFSFIFPLTRKLWLVILSQLVKRGVISNFKVVTYQHQTARPAGGERNPFQVKKEKALNNKPQS